MILPAPARTGRNSRSHADDGETTTFPAEAALTCWASAIASWNRVKGLVGANVTDQTLINHYRRYRLHRRGATLIGDINADVEAVFAEWRLRSDLSTEVPDFDWTLEFVKSLIEKHGHSRVVVTGDISLMHAMVVYGVRLDDISDPTQFTVFVEDPICGGQSKRPGCSWSGPIRVCAGHRQEVLWSGALSQLAPPRSSARGRNAQDIHARSSL